MNRKIALVLFLPFQFAIAAGTQTNAPDRPLGQLSFSSYVIENSRLLQKRKRAQYQIAFVEATGAIDRMPASAPTPSSSPSPSGSAAAGSPAAAGAAGAPGSANSAGSMTGDASQGLGAPPAGADAGAGGSSWTPAQLNAPGASGTPPAGSP